MSCGAVILAAGASRRLGTPKQLVEFRRRPLVVDAVEKARDTGCDPIVVVTGAHGAHVEAALASIAGLTVIRNDDWAAGQGTTVAAGIRALRAIAPKTDAALMLLCDQPLVPVGHLRTLVAAVGEDGIDIGATRYDDGSGGVPACFASTCFDALAGLDGPIGARTIIADSHRRTRCFDAPSARVDVDTPDDVVRLTNGA